jgi:hypothetical protein
MAASLLIVSRQVFKDKHKYYEPYQTMKKVVIWGEEGKKLFTFQRSVYQSSSLAQDAEKKP